MTDAVVIHHADGARPPLVFLHTWDTDRDNLAALADFLGPDQPLYGIEPPDPAAGPMPERVPQWVTHARAVLATLPISPPYRLAGFSFGGVIALELARALQAEGHPVAWVGLVDCLRPKLNPKGAGAYVRYHLQDLLDLPDASSRWAKSWHLLRTGLGRSLRRVQDKVARELADRGLRERRPVVGSDRQPMTPLKRAIWVSYLSYEPERYDHPVTLFTGDENRASAAGDPSLRWSLYLRGGFEVVPVAGAHLEMFAPTHVASVGGAIRDRLAVVG